MTLLENKVQLGEVCRKQKEVFVAPAPGALRWRTLVAPDPYFIYLPTWHAATKFKHASSCLKGLYLRHVLFRFGHLLDIALRNEEAERAEPRVPVKRNKVEPSRIQEPWYRQDAMKVYSPLSGSGVCP
jgi:hypothetical protein